MGVHVAPAALEPVLVELDRLAAPQDAARKLAALHLRATRGALERMQSWAARMTGLE